MARRYGSGGIEANGRGWRWTAYVEGRRVRSRNYPTKQIAEQVLAESLRRLDMGDRHAEDLQSPALRSPGSGGLTVGQWGASWLQQRSNRAATMDASRWKMHIEQSCLAKIALVDLGKRDVRAWLAQLQQTRVQIRRPGGVLEPGSDFVSFQSVKHCVTLLRRALGDAVEQELIDSNPAVGMRLRAPPQTEEPWTFLTVPEIALLFEWLQANAGPERLALYAVAVYAGLRKGELIPLRWCDVELGARPQITVRFSRRSGTKSGKIRRVPLLPAAADALRVWHAIFNARPEAEKRRAWAGRSPEYLVFPSSRGGAWHSDYEFGWPDVSKGKQGVLTGIKSRCGITRAVRFHDLRHTCGSHLLMGTWGGASWTLQEVKEVLGHSTIKMTERYAHLSQDHLHEKAAKTTKEPLNGPNADPAATHLPSVGVARFEPATFGFGGLTVAQGSQGDRGDLGLFEGLLRTAAITLLMRAAKGQGIPAEVLVLLGVDPADPFAIQLGIDKAREALAAPMVDRGTG